MLKRVKDVISLLLVICLLLNISSYRAFPAPAQKILSVKDIIFSIGQGEKFSLPLTVKAVMWDKKVKDVAVKWDKAKADTSKIGQFKYSGVISGYKNKVTLLLKVVPVIKSISDLEYSISCGEDFKVPKTVTALMSDNSTKDFNVVWESYFIDTNEPGEYLITGRVDGYSSKVNIHLVISKAKASQDDTNKSQIPQIKNLQLDTSQYSELHIYGDADFSTNIRTQLGNDILVFAGAASYDKSFTLSKKGLYIISCKQQFSWLPQELSSQIKPDDYNNIGEFGVLNIKIQNADFYIIGSSVQVIRDKTTAGKLNTNPYQEVFDKIKKYHKNPDYNDTNSLLKFGSLSRDTDKVEALAKQANDKKDMSTLLDIFKIVSSIPDANFYGDGQRLWDVDKVIDKGKRSCDDYATLFGALARAKGIPTLEVTAYDINALYYNNSNYKKGIWTGFESGHEFLEVKLSDGKWYLVDSTRGYAYLNYDYNNYSLPNGYLVFSKETDTGDFGTDRYFEGMIFSFLDYSAEGYKDPAYQYIDIRNGLSKNSEPHNMQIIMGRDPLIAKSSEISRSAMDALCTKVMILGMPLQDFDYNIAKKNNLNDYNLIYLYTYGKPVPPELEQYFPQIKTMKPGDVYYYTDFSKKSSNSIGPTIKFLIVGNESGEYSFDSILNSLDPKKVYGLN